MHRKIEITSESTGTDELVDRLCKLEDVIAVSVSRGASRKPPGDVVNVTALNRGANDVMRAAQALQKRSRVLVVTSDLASINDPPQQERIEDDVDEELWEEVETGLRHSTHVTWNYVALMALGGAIATLGIVEHGVPQGIAFVASAIVAPGFEPLAKLPMGLVLGSRDVAKRALVSAVAGYAALLAAAGGITLLLKSFGLVRVEELRRNSELLAVMGTGPVQNLMSLSGAIAGMIMIASYREQMLAGPLIALALIPAAAMMPAMLVAGDAGLFQIAAIRCGLDMATIIVTSAVFIWAKQRLVHQREPML